MNQPAQPIGPLERNMEAMQRLVMDTFVALLRETNLAPMTVLEYAAGAIGAVYRDVAAAHRPPSVCPCGWRPDSVLDLQVLQAKLVWEALGDHTPDLAAASVAGHA